MKYAPPSSREEIISRYSLGERCFADTELDYSLLPKGGPELSHMMLDNVDFSDSLFRASFRGSSLRGAKFINANVKGCDFSECDLTGAEFSNAALESTRWFGAKLAGIKFGEVNIYGVVRANDEIIELIKEREL